MACRLFGTEPLPEPMRAHYQMDPWEITYMWLKFKSKYEKHFWRNCIWKCCLQIIRHLVFRAMDWYVFLVISLICSSSQKLSYLLYLVLYDNLRWHQLRQSYQIGDFLFSVNSIAFMVTSLAQYNNAANHSLSIRKQNRHGKTQVNLSHSHNKTKHKKTVCILYWIYGKSILVRLGDNPLSTLQWRHGAPNYRNSVQLNNKVNIRVPNYFPFVGWIHR